MKLEKRPISTIAVLLLVVCFIWYTYMDILYKKHTYYTPSYTNALLDNVSTISWSHFTVSDRLPGFIYKVSIPKCGTFFTSSFIDRMSSICKTRVQYKWMHCISKPDSIRTHALARHKTVFANKTSKIVIIRDLRDMFVSLAHYSRKQVVLHKSKDTVVYWGKLAITNTAMNALRVELQNMSVSDWLLRTIVDDSGVDHVPHLFKFLIRETVALIDSDPHIPVFWYEDLVGAQGGGSDKIRYKVIGTTIGLGACADGAVQHIMNLTNARLNKLTFRKGVIGEWKTVFNATHLQIFNDIYGQVFSRMGRPLIEQMDNY